LLKISPHQRHRGQLLVTGVSEGEISMYYDPMIAKLCAWAPYRLTAINRMAAALDDFEIEGGGGQMILNPSVADRKVQLRPKPVRRTNRGESCVRYIWHAHLALSSRLRALP
jgi:hypothetical protein